jgi:carboxyl-terminal processing protease
VRLLTLVGLVLALLGGVWLGGHPENLPRFLQDLLVDDGQAVRAELIDTIARDYYKPVSRGKLEEASLDGMVASLGDPYSRYFTPKQAQTFDADLNGRFEGIGVSVRAVRAGLEIVDVIPESPAKRAGLRPGDVITKVNGKSIAGSAAATAPDRIKGPPGTSVTLTIERKGKVRKLPIKRAKIQQQLVTGKLVRRGKVPIAVVELRSFGSAVHGKLRSEIDRLRGRGAKGIVLDLRHNGGGLLRESVLVASIFIENGTIVTTKGRSKPSHTYKAQGHAIPGSIPVAVLVDRGSASASEIVTGALRDTKRATVVGTRTFGKGVFQEIEPLSNGGALDLTVGRYYLPSGEPLPAGGIKAQVPARDNPATARDEALPVALRQVAARHR